MTEKAKFLYKQAFPEEIDRDVFIDRLMPLDDHISPEFIDRKEWYEKWGKFLEETWKSDKFGPLYKLYLPKDLKVSELPAIIYRVNKLAFWDNLPIRASTRELKGKIVFAVDILLSRLRKHNKDEKEIKKAIKKYVRLYAQLFWEEESHELNNPDHRKQIIETQDEEMKREYDWTKQYESYTDYQKKIFQIGTKEKIEELWEEIEETIAEETEKHFEEALFELWIENLTWRNSVRLWLQTIIQADLEEVEKRKKRIDEGKEEWDITIRVKKEDLDKEERKLRDKIWIDEYKKELEKFREIWREEDIVKRELEIVKNVFSVLYDYPYQLTEDRYWTQISKIERYKQVYCVWFSLIWHGLFSELGIKHDAIDFLEHSILSVFIWWKNYYFDPTRYKRTDMNIPDLLEFTYWRKVWVYKEIELPWGKQYGSSWPAEKVLLAQVYNNKGIHLEKAPNKLGDTKEEALIVNKKAIKVIQKAILINPNNVVAYINLWRLYQKIWEYSNSIVAFNESIVRYPGDSIGYFPDADKVYYGKSFSFYKLGKYKESINSISEVQKKSPIFLKAYWKKWLFFLFLKLKEEKGSLNYNRFSRLSSLNNSISFLMDWKKYDEINEYEQETQKIKEFIEKNNYTWLRDYMLSLEEWLFDKIEKK